MGCDIHLHIEVKVDGEWLHYSAPYVSRFYPMFAKMSGVRKDGSEDDDLPDPIAWPRGLPQNPGVVMEYDISTVTRHAWEADKKKYPPHHVSYLNQHEIKILSDWLWDYARDMGEDPVMTYDLEHSILQCYLEGNCFHDGNPDWVEDVQFVFWFDN